MTKTVLSAIRSALGAIGWIALYTGLSAAAQLMYYALGAPADSATLAGTATGDIAMAVIWCVLVARRNGGYVPPATRRFEGRDATAFATVIATGWLFGETLAMTWYATFGSTSWEKSSRTMTSSGVLASLVIAVIVAPVCEECLFRGLVMDSLTKRLKGAASATTAVIVSAVTFGALHGNMIQGIAAGVLGVGLAMGRIRFGSLMPGMAAHFLFNIVGLLVPTALLEPLENPACIIAFGTLWLYVAIRTWAVWCPKDAADTAANDGAPHHTDEGQKTAADATDMSRGSAPASPTTQEENTGHGPHAAPPKNTVASTDTTACDDGIASTHDAEPVIDPTNMAESDHDATSTHDAAGPGPCAPPKPVTASAHDAETKPVTTPMNGTTHDVTAPPEPVTASAGIPASPESVTASADTAAPPERRMP